MTTPLKDSLLIGDNAAYLEEMRARYQEHPDSVGSDWQQYFASEQAVDHHQLTRDIAARALMPRATANTGQADDSYIVKQCAVNQLITQYRILGVRQATINPLAYEVATNDRLALANYGLNDADLDTEFNTDIIGLERANLRDIVARLQAVYCGTMVPEFMHICNEEQRRWLFERFEGVAPQPTIEEQKKLLERLIAAETLEKYLHTRYVGQKRFSLEGGDSLIPLLDVLLTHAGANGVLETVIGMAHRGRLNVLVNVLGKQPANLFKEFEGKHANTLSSGDVKYHMGFSSTLENENGNMHLALAFNPSHLEIVHPVAQGSVRARQDRRNDQDRKQVLPLQIHGDAAFAGQGVVMETFNFAQARGFKAGGSIHIVINNQIGFTTSTPDDARSTFFCTDVGKMVEIPIVHVNCDDIFGLFHAAKTAFDYRQKFGVDVIIDLVCFRRHGHNEQDEPFMTQPFMYQKIAKHPGSTKRYADQLIAAGVLTAAEVENMQKAFRSKLEEGESANPNVVPTETNQFVDWKNYTQMAKSWEWKPKKPVPVKTLQKFGKTLSALPDDFTPHTQLQRLIKQRQEMAAGKRPLDWGMAENLSYATLLAEGVNVRLSGQDCGRGTFSHRHAVWHDQKRDKRDGGNYVPLRHLAKKQGDFLVIDSILSEAGVLAFEYGYATTNPQTMVLWEAQFGDFANSAQVVIDQFIASGEAKWGRFCGLTMLLPHGYEGQGPEHSSARLERYLQLCAEYNIQVCVPSSPAQIYHLLRRQMLRTVRRPLIVISPKSLLRNPEAVSSLEELSSGNFEAVIGESDSNIKAKNVKRVVFCSGKIYYEVRAARREKKQTDVAICRLEQLYPFPHAEVEAQIKKYAAAEHVVWCQEEPGNQGAWHRMQHYFRRHLNKGQILKYALRPSSASPAVGFADVHKRQQQEVIDAALNF
ncbi:MAG: 2-oxoglutarate dehydrogenase E1 component [Proteobacteria bacterium]|nr:2-oxoglutarate dehydrogenase E1 component [Pseudomonadota bacterium]